MINDDTAVHAEQTTFLDLLINYSGGIFRYSTYRKPLNLYQYLPYSSNHSPATKQGIVATKVHRMLITNRFKEDFEQQLQFFAEKLSERGYPLHVIVTGFAKYSWDDKRDILGRKPASPGPCGPVPFKLRWPEHFEGLNLKQLLGADLVNVI